MLLSKNITHMYEPTSLSCGQTVLAMLLGCNVEHIIKLLGKKNEITLKDIFCVLEDADIKISQKKSEATEKSQLPQIAVLSLKTPFCWHWSLYYNGLFLDPEYGVLENFPPNEKCFYWQILK